MAELIDIILHLDQHLLTWVNFFGPWIYVMMFLVIFCETGLVVTPFLPGDSLLFALGALAALRRQAVPARGAGRARPLRRAGGRARGPPARGCWP